MLLSEHLGLRALTHDVAGTGGAAGRAEGTATFEALLGHGVTVSAICRDVRNGGGYRSLLLRTRGGVLGQPKDTGDT